eukprot:175527_1
MLKRVKMQTAKKQTMQPQNDEGNDSKWICKICLDRLKEPVVTQCGHLFCWSCLTRWLDRQLSCPMCQGGINKSMITPIYGHDDDHKDNDWTTNNDTNDESKSNRSTEDIPSRPTGNREEPPPRRNNNFHFEFQVFGFGLCDLISQVFTENNGVYETDQERMDDYLSKGIALALFTTILMIVCGMI